MDALGAVVQHYRMGTWGPGALDNDGAADFVGDVGDGGRSVLLEVLYDFDRTPDAIEACIGLAAAEIVAALGGKAAEHYGGDEGLMAAVDSLGGPVGDNTVSQARRVARRCGGPGELAELWEDDLEWADAVTDLLNRLQSLPETGRDDKRLVVEEAEAAADFEFGEEAQRLIDRLSKLPGADVDKGPAGVEILFATQRRHRDGSRYDLTIHVDWDSGVELSLGAFRSAFAVSDEHTALGGIDLDKLVEGFRVGDIRLLIFRVGGVVVRGCPARTSEVDRVVGEFFARYRPNWITRQALKFGKALEVKAQVMAQASADDRTLEGTLTKAGFAPYGRGDEE